MCDHVPAPLNKDILKIAKHQNVAFGNKRTRVPWVSVLCSSATAYRPSPPLCRSRPTTDVHCHSNPRQLSSQAMASMVAGTCTEGAPAIRDDVESTAGLRLWFECIGAAEEAVRDVINVCERDIVVSPPEDPKLTAVTQRYFQTRTRTNAHSAHIPGAKRHGGGMRACWQCPTLLEERAYPSGRTPGAARPHTSTAPRLATPCRYPCPSYRSHAKLPAPPTPWSGRICSSGRICERSATFSTSFETVS